jgi:hypothetical protein
MRNKKNQRNPIKVNQIAYWQLYNTEIEQKKEEINTEYQNHRRPNHLHLHLSNQNQRI